MSLYSDQYIIQINYINNRSQNYIIFSKNIHKIYDIFQNNLDNVTIIHIVKFIDNKFEDFSFGSENSIILDYQREELFEWISNQYKKN